MLHNAYKFNLRGNSMRKRQKKIDGDHGFRVRR
ncbi:hypothetical protein [Marinobacter sp. LV10R510-11A]|nr:hypothetical protein [Marinobacter sp. LV10R510-11A]